MISLLAPREEEPAALSGFSFESRRQLERKCQTSDVLGLCARDSERALLHCCDVTWMRTVLLCV